MTIRVTCRGKTVASGVHAVETVGRDQQDAGATDPSGTLTLRSATPGRHVYIVGRGAVGADGAPAVPLTDDRYLPSTITVNVRRGRSTAAASVDLRPAAHITGHVVQPSRHRVLVIAEDATGVPVRVAAATKGTFSLGGLRPGSYRLIAEDGSIGRYVSRRVDDALGATAALRDTLRPKRVEPVLSGRLADSGSVLLRSAVDLRVFRRQFQSDSSGRFRLRIFPGRFVPVAFVSDRIQAVGHPLTVTASREIGLASGSRPATVRGRGRINGGIVPISPSVVGPRTVNEEFAEGGAFVDTYPTTTQGRSFVGTDLPEGDYRVGTLDGSVPVQDGPWHYDVQHKAFHLTADRTTDIGFVRITIAG